MKHAVNYMILFNMKTVTLIPVPNYINIML